MFRYINLLVGRKRLDEAILIAEMAVKLDHEPRSHEHPNRLTQLINLPEQLKKMSNK